MPASIIVAIWGRETGFGGAALPYDAVSAIATQAFMGRRPDEFRPQLIGALKIIQLGHATRAEMRSSWAGAMGHTQFLPGDFEDYAVDFDGDGRRDIWNSVTDALASAGNSLHSQGWDGNQPWAYEVELPKTFDCTQAGPGPGAADPGVDRSRRAAGARAPLPGSAARRLDVPRPAGRDERAGFPRDHQFLGVEAL